VTAPPGDRARWIAPVFTHAISDIAAVDISGAFVEPIATARRRAGGLTPLTGATVGVARTETVDEDAALEARLVFDLFASVVVATVRGLVTSVA
jgi:hypothetical protein